MRFGLITNLKRTGALQAIDDFRNWAEVKGHEITVCIEVDELSGRDFHGEYRKDVANKVDMLVSMGGDGTLLATARLVGTTEKPVLGINLGSLGFLTQLTPAQLIPAIEAIIDGKYEIEERMLLKVEIPGGINLENPYALNDVVVNNGTVSRLVEINLLVNNEEVVTYRADGLVIATPTGSTAYSLAVGGPIMHPKLEGIIASPISSFSLSTRPMIFSAKDTLEIKVLSGLDNAALTLDGQVMLPFKDFNSVVISRAEVHLKLIVFPENSYYKLLKNKLHWGLSPLANNDRGKG